jgi:hypothetical protein
MRCVSISALAIVLSLSFFASASAFAGGTCMSHYNQCSVIRSNNGGNSHSTDCNARLEECKASGVWTNGHGQKIPAKK